MPAHVWRAALIGLCTALPPTETGTITAPTLIICGDRDELLRYDLKLWIGDLHEGVAYLPH
jgi:hypothetical protein